MAQKNRIWFITEYFHPVNVSSGYFITEIAKKFVSKGYDVCVITTSSGYFGNNESKSIRFETYVGIKIFRISSSSFNNNKIYARLFGLLQIGSKLFLSILKNISKDDIVFSTTNPAFLPLFTYLASVLIGFKYKIIVHDLFPENLVPAGLVSEQSLIYKISTTVFNYAYKNASDIIVIGQDMRELLELKIDKLKTKLHLIPNWADTSSIQVEQTNANGIRKALNIGNELILLYSGNIGRLQNIEIILELARRLSNDNVIFIFIGSGAAEAQIESYINNHNMSNVLHFGPMEKSEQQKFLNASDLGLVCLRAGMRGLGVPGKTYSILASGRPIFYIGDHLSEVHQIISNYNVGWAFQDKELDAMVKLLQNLKNNPEEISKTGKAAREIAECKYSKESSLEQYLTTI